jgi:hypothetical protein
MALTNDLDSIEVNNDLRPYFGSLNAHDDNLATIILLTETPPNKAENVDFANYDYLTTFTEYVDTPSVPGDQITSLSANYIPKLYEMITPGVTQYYGIFNNFSLTGVTEAKDQMVKVHMNFGGSWNAFFFGDKPTVYSFNGFFLDSKEYPYYQEFMVAYDNYLAGRKCVENKFQMLIAYDGKIIGGYILNISVSSNSNNPYMKAFNFSVLIASEGWYRTNIVRNLDNKFVSGFNYMSSARTAIANFKYANMVNP